MNITTRNDFGKLCELHKLTGTGAEVGVQYGVFSERIAEHYTGKILCVDLWGNKPIYEECQQRLNKPNFEMIRMPSLTAASMITDGILDFVYIDANHFYEHVKADIAAWYPKVRSGGIFAGHDYCVFKDIEVIPAVDEWAAANGYTINLTTEDFFEGNPFPTWWVVKR